MGNDTGSMHTYNVDHEGVIRCVAGTLAIEGIELSESSIHNIARYASGKASYEQILHEIIEKYKR